MRQQLDDVKGALRGRWIEVLATVCGLPAEVLNGRHQACPSCGGSDRFRAFNDADDTGGAICNKCGTFADGFEVVRWLKRVDFPEALRLVADAVGMMRVEHQPKRAAANRRPEEKPNPKFLEFLRAQGAAKLPTLAAELGVGVESLRKIGAGWYPSGTCWTFEERAGGQVVGVMRRFADGEKRLIRGGKRGLTYADDWHKAAGAVLVVEGASDVAAGIGLGLRVIGRPAAKVPRELLPSLAGLLRECADSELIVVGERDSKPDGSWPGRDGAMSSAKALAVALGRPVRWALPPEGFKDLRQWVQRNPSGTGEQFLQLLEGGESIQPDGDDKGPALPWVELRFDEAATNDEVLRVLSALKTPEVFSFAAELGRLVWSDDGRGRFLKFEEDSLRELISRAVELLEISEGKDGEEIEKQKRVPAWMPKGILARAEWPEVRQLKGVSERPVLRPDGTICAALGYDAGSRMFLSWEGQWPEIKHSPTLDDARAAADELLGVVADFPWSEVVDKVAWLAGVLTPLARPLYSGPVGPILAIDANVRGSGKTLLSDVLSVIVCGRVVPRQGWPEDPAEQRKRITSLLIGGGDSELWVFDNIAGRFGSEVVDIVATSDSWRDRVLGESRMLEFPLRALWVISGNNLTLRADTSRRLLRARLRSRVEHPEERPAGEFRHPDLLGWVREHRRRLCAAALTILRAWVVAGKPVPRMQSWGSFEGWSGVVRAALIWCGLPDPGETRRALREESDESEGGLLQLLHSLAAADPDRRGMSSGALLKAARGEGEDRLRAALEAVTGREIGRLSVSEVGRALGRYRQRPLSGVTIEMKKLHGERLWFVVGEFDLGGEGAEGGDDFPLPAGARGQSHGSEVCSGELENSGTLATIATLGEIEFDLSEIYR
jgi:phage/plasmid primase-like uncharacterized protein